MKTKKKGFTLIELLAALAIMGIIITICVYSYLSYKGKSDEKIKKTELAQLKTAAGLYYREFKDDEGFNKLVDKDNNIIYSCIKFSSLQEKGYYKGDVDFNGDDYKSAVVKVTDNNGSIDYTVINDSTGDSICGSNYVTISLDGKKHESRINYTYNPLGKLYCGDRLFDEKYKYLESKYLKWNNYSNKFTDYCKIENTDVKYNYSSTMAVKDGKDNDIKLNFNTSASSSYLKISKTIKKPVAVAFVVDIGLDNATEDDQFFWEARTNFDIAKNLYKTITDKSHIHKVAIIGYNGETITHNTFDSINDAKAIESQFNTLEDEFNPEHLGSSEWGSDALKALWLTNNFLNNVGDYEKYVFFISSGRINMTQGYRDQHDTNQGEYNQCDGSTNGGELINKQECKDTISSLTSSIKSKSNLFWVNDHEATEYAGSYKYDKKISSSDEFNVDVDFIKKIENNGNNNVKITTKYNGYDNYDLARYIDSNGLKIIGAYNNVKICLNPNVTKYISVYDNIKKKNVSLTSASCFNYNQSSLFGSNDKNSLKYNFTFKVKDNSLFEDENFWKTDSGILKTCETENNEVSCMMPLFGDEGVKTSLGHPAPIGSTTSLSFDTGVYIYFTKRNNSYAN